MRMEGHFTEYGLGGDFRLMTRVLPRPLGLQGGKSMSKPIDLFVADFKELNKD
jgi:hypothetical protein